LKQLGFTTPAGQPALAAMQDFFVNTAFWLARSIHWSWLLDYVLALPLWVEVFDPGGPIERDPWQILRYGTLMRQELARYVRDAITVESIGEALRVEGLVDVLLMRGESRAGRLASYSDDIVASVLGGAALEMIRARSVKSKGLDQMSEARAARDGMITGRRALGGLLRHQSEESAALAAKLLKAGSSY
jgi:hypothetical protein